MSIAPGRRRPALELALAALGAALLGGTALGIISPRFTPVHLTQQSKTILVGKDDPLLHSVLHKPNTQRLPAAKT